jgi:ribosomal protein L7/L12
MSQPQVLPPEVLRALERGQLIEAIKLLRQSRGLGLKEAKHVVDAHMGRGSPPHAAKTHAAQTRAAQTHAAQPHEPMHAAPAHPPPSAPADNNGVLAALQAGNKIEAIRRMRNATGMSLKQAKEAVDVLEGKGLSYQHPGLAPGEVPSSSSRFNWVVLAIAAALIAWFLLRR